VFLEKKEKNLFCPQFLIIAPLARVFHVLVCELDHQRHNTV